MMALCFRTACASRGSRRAASAIPTLPRRMRTAQATQPATSANVSHSAATAWKKILMDSAPVTTSARIVHVSPKDVIVTQILKIQMNFVQQTKNVISANA